MRSRSSRGRSRKGQLVGAVGDMTDAALDAKLDAKIECQLVDEGMGIEGCNQWSRDLES